jgi:D-erythronate 2-dehydrogenase
MNIVITGGAGFLGSALVKKLLSDCQDINEIRVVDIAKLDIGADESDKVVSTVADMTNPDEIANIINENTTHVFHLAAIVSSHAEQDFDLGMSVNLKATQLLLERCRQVNPAIRFVFSSSVAVFGGKLPDEIDAMTALQPSSSYGTQKAIGELLVNDYARKGFVDALSVRLPTVCIRPGAPNKAASSFVSGIMREPLKREASNCPVDVNLPLWVSSPQTVIQNLIHASQINTEQLPGFRTLSLPGLQTCAKEMISSLAKQAGNDFLEYISYDKDPAIEPIVSSWPKSIDVERELSLGFKKDRDFDSILNQYIEQHPIS